MAEGKLVIRAKKCGHSDVFQLIPPHTLASDLPSVLIENHVHWLNLSAGTIEIRPLSSLWQSSADNWCIQFIPGRHSMAKGHFILFDIRSTTWNMLSGLLKPLQDPQDLMVTWDCRSSTVSVDLPRYGLSFFINSDWELESCHPRGMVYDGDQSIGTLFGLVNKLVLRPKDNLGKDLVQRQVLIPEGNIRYGSHRHHVKVLVDIKGPADQNIPYQTFRIDTDLGCLIGNSGLASNFYRAYLHALCSNPCSVDPLTGKTGTEEALTTLRSAAAGSFLKVDDRAAKLLGRIAALTTGCKWYPPHLRRMQTIHWAPLPTASQHYNLYLSCVLIKKIHQTLQVFHGNPPHSMFEGFPERDDHLLRRIGVRAALLDPPEFCDVPGGNHDDVYKARDIIHNASGEARAFGTARVVYLWSTKMPRAKNIRALLESWGQQLAGATARPSVSLRYSRAWLSPELHLIWLSSYNACRNSQMDRHRFQLLFTLPAMVYASPDLEEVAHTLLAFATMSQFRHESPPPHASYCLSDGYTPSPQVLYSFISSSAVQHWGSPERDYGQRLRRDAATLHAKTIAMWPSWTPPSLSFLNTSLYNLSTLTSQVGRVFESCYQNFDLKQHLDRVQLILDQGDTTSRISSAYNFLPSSPTRLPHDWRVALWHLLHRRAPISLLTPEPITASTEPYLAGSEKLNRLVDVLRRNGKNSFHTKYADDLRTSKDHLVYNKITFSPESLPQCGDQFKAHYIHYRTAYFQCLRVLADTFAPQTPSEHAIYESGQWPRITVKDLLRCLGSTSKVAIPTSWRHCLMSFAKLILEYQRSRRILLLAMNGQLEDLCKELENTGCSGWDAESHPDWLLIQVSFVLLRI